MNTKITKGQKLTVKHYGHERTGTVIRVISESSVLGAFVTLKLDTPYEQTYKFPVKNPVTVRTISLRVKQS